MTVTVIIIAVIIVLAVLVLLLLGMRALSLGSREDDYDDDYEYDEAEEHGHDHHEDEEPRGRSRRSRQGGGKAERRPKKRRGVDWEDDPDELSDNDFWSSLSEEGPAQRQSTPPARAIDEYDYDDYDDPEEGYEDECDDRAAPPGVPSPLASSGGGMAALANLGQESGPQQPYHAELPDESAHRTSASFDQQELPPRPEPSALPPTQGLPPTQPAGASYQDDPLGRPSWAAGDPLSGPPERARAPRGDDPLGGAGAPARNERNDPLGAPSGSYGAPNDRGPGTYSPTQGPSAGDPFGSRSPHDSGTHSRPADQYQNGRPGAPNPLDPDFRPSAPARGSDTSSPIWSSMDTGAHQRPDPSVLRGPAPEGVPGSEYGAQRPHEYPTHTTPGPYGQSPTGDPLSGGYPSMSRPEQGFHDGYGQRSPYDSGTHARPAYETDPYGMAGPGGPTAPGGPGGPGEPGGPGPQRSPYDSGTHARPAYDTDPYGMTNPGGPNAPGGPGGHGGPGGPGGHGGPGPQRSPYDSGTHSRPAYDTDSFSRPEQGFDPGYTQRSPYDSGTHARPTYDTDPYGMTNPGGPNAPGSPGGHGGPGPQGPPPPYDGGMHGGPVRPGPAYPGDGPHPGDAHGYPPMPPTGGYPADQLRGEPRDYGEQPPGPYNTPSGGYSDVLGGDYPPHRSEYGGYPPSDGWNPREQAPGQGAYDPRGYPQEYYEGGYDNGRFH